MMQWPVTVKAKKQFIIKIVVDFALSCIISRSAYFSLIFISIKYDIYYYKILLLTYLFMVLQSMNPGILREREINETWSRFWNFFFENWNRISNNFYFEGQFAKLDGIIDHIFLFYIFIIYFIWYFIIYKFLK